MILCAVVCMKIGKKQKLRFQYIAFICLQFDTLKCNFSCCFEYVVHSIYSLQPQDFWSDKIPPSLNALESNTTMAGYL